MILVLAYGRGLHPSEKGQHVAVGPTPRALPLPLVIVRGSPPKKDEAIDGAGSAEHLSSCPDQGSVGDSRIRLGPVAPQVFGIHRRLAESHRNVEPRIPILVAGFDEANVRISLLGQPGGNDAAGGAGSHHNDIEDVVELRKVRLHASGPGAHAREDRRSRRRKHSADPMRQRDLHVRDLSRRRAS